jgi:hypothetical protein
MTMPLELRFTGGHPDTAEIAVITAVLSARAASAGRTAAPRTIRSIWSSRSRLVREPLPRGPGGWRASALPR